MTPANPPVAGRDPAAVGDPASGRDAAGRDRDAAGRDRDAAGRDRDAAGRPRNARPRDRLGRPLPYGAASDGAVLKGAVSEGAVSVGAATEGAVRPAAESLELAQRLLDSGRPFHAHEVLEDAWKSAAGADRELWRGLAQLAVGLTHLARGNGAGVVPLLRRGALSVESAGPFAPHGVDSSGLISWAQALASGIEDGTLDIDGAAALQPPRLRREGS